VLGGKEPEVGKRVQVVVNAFTKERIISAAQKALLQERRPEMTRIQGRDQVLNITTPAIAVGEFETLQEAVSFDAALSEV
jgi:hypothetical protein